MRALERAAAAGDAAAEEALLRRRLGVGDLALRKLRVAAYLGHPPAEQAFGERLRAKDQRLDKWVRGLVHFGGEAAGERVVIALAEAALPRFERHAPEERRPAKALNAARESLCCPCDPHEVAAARAGEEAWHAAEDLAARETLGTSHWGHVHHSGVQAARLVAYAARRLSRRIGPPYYGETCESLAESLLGAKRVRQVIRRALLPWALEGREGAGVGRTTPA